jgi:CysZ protein
LGLTLIVGIVSRALLFAPGIGFVAWLAANAYLLGREYFELAAMRFHSGAQASALRRHHAGLVFVCGAMIAVFVAIPLVDLLTPLFATTLMVRLHKRIARVG